MLDFVELHADMGLAMYVTSDLLKVPIGGPK